MSDSTIYEADSAQRDADSVTLLRILDVLYALLAVQNPEYAKKVVDKHAEGGLIGPVPQFDPERLL